MAKLPPLPLVLTANALRDGDVVYLGADGWTPSLAEAVVAEDVAAAEALDARRAESEAAGETVDPFLAPVQRDADGRLSPLHYREKIRAVGPTVQHAFNPETRPEHRHVSL